MQTGRPFCGSVTADRFTALAHDNPYRRFVMTEKTITLELTEMEAKVLAEIYGEYIIGVETGYRQYTTSVYKALTSLPGFSLCFLKDLVDEGKSQHYGRLWLK
jgi:hypothetical protein